MNRQRLIAKTVMQVSLVGWLMFVLLELLMPTSVMRTFSPHLFLLGLFVGLIWWYRLSDS